MRFLACLSLALVSLVTAIAIVAKSSYGQPDNKPLKITAAELRRATIIGDLGAPLGTLVTIEGTFQHIQDNKETKYPEDALLLVIDRVDGKALKEPVRIYELSSSWVSPEERPKRDGKPFKFRGYEFARIWGDVDGEEEYEGERADIARPFGYDSDLAILFDVLNGVSVRDLRRIRR